VGGTWAYRIDLGSGRGGGRKQQQVSCFGSRQEAEGYWVINTDDISSVAPQSFKRARASIRDHLADQERQQRFGAWLTEQLRTADVHVNASYGPLAPGLLALTTVGPSAAPMGRPRPAWQPAGWAQTVPSICRRVAMARVMAPRAALVSARALSMTKSWMIPPTRTATTGTPAERSLAA
jgi:hypothetical protein